MTQTGLDIVGAALPSGLRNRRLGVLCHAASVTQSLVHALEVFGRRSDCRLAAVFGPQHGLFGQTQDNMIEWEGCAHPVYEVPVFSLYGATRKPSPVMLSGLDAFVVDLQDVGARPYTYIWTVKLCMEACAEAGIPVWVLDRPNPIGAIAFDGPMLRPEFFSFVGGARVPLCHRMTIGELSVLLQQAFYPGLELHIVWMRDWWRSSLFPDTGLPWVLPSPNMPFAGTAAVYPGMVLLEGTNVSEGRGTTRPFELFGAPQLDMKKFRECISTFVLPGCVLREHHFIPAFQKWAGTYCRGMQIHVTEPRRYRPVFTAAALLSAVIKSTGGAFAFTNPPYEYEYRNMPFDILSGSAALRECLESGGRIDELGGLWVLERTEFESVFEDIRHYPEEPA